MKGIFEACEDITEKIVLTGIAIAWGHSATSFTDGSGHSHEGGEQGYGESNDLHCVFWDRFVYVNMRC